jgi:hypothetical protein
VFQVVTQKYAPFFHSKETFFDAEKSERWYYFRNNNKAMLTANAESKKHNI